MALIYRSAVIQELKTWGGGRRVFGGSWAHDVIFRVYGFWHQDALFRISKEPAELKRKVCILAPRASTLLRAIALDLRDGKNENTERPLFWLKLRGEGDGAFWGFWNLVRMVVGVSGGLEFVGD